MGVGGAIVPAVGVAVVRVVVDVVGEGVVGVCTGPFKLPLVETLGLPSVHQTLCIMGLPLSENRLQVLQISDGIGSMYTDTLD